MPGRDAGAVDLCVLQVPAHPADRTAETCDGPELRRQQHTALRRLDQGSFRSVRLRQRRGAGVLDHFARRGGLFHPRHAKAFVQDRFRFRQPFAGCPGDRLFLQLSDDLVKSECNHILCHGIPLLPCYDRHEQQDSENAPQEKKHTKKCPASVRSASWHQQTSDHVIALIVQPCSPLTNRLQTHLRESACSCRISAGMIIDRGNPLVNAPH